MLWLTTSHRSNLILCESLESQDLGCGWVLTCLGKDLGPKCLRVADPQRLNNRKLPLICLKEKNHFGLEMNNFKKHKQDSAYLPPQGGTVLNSCSPSL